MVRITPEGVTTHDKGNALYGIWVSPNFKVIKATLKDGLNDVKDHSMIEVTLFLDKSFSRSLPNKIDTYTTQAVIRKYQLEIKSWENENLKVDSLSKPLRSILQNMVPKKRK